MKLWKKSLVVALAAIMLAATTATAFAAPDDSVQFEFSNKTGTSVQLTLKGPTDTVINVAAGARLTKTELLPGEYTYRYSACGRIFRGTFNVVDGANSAFVLRKCSNALMSSIVLNNQTGNAFILTLNGQNRTYGFWISPGRNVLSVLAGGYSFNSNACGSPSGQLKASQRAKSVWVWDCNANNDKDSVNLVP